MNKLNYSQQRRNLTIKRRLKKSWSRSETLSFGHLIEQTWIDRHEQFYYWKERRYVVRGVLWGRVWRKGLFGGFCVGEVWGGGVKAGVTRAEHWHARQIGQDCIQTGTITSWTDVWTAFKIDVVCLCCCIQYFLCSSCWTDSTGFHCLLKSSGHYLDW